MERIWIFLFLYGALTIIGIFLTCFWLRFAVRRAKLIDHPFWKDRAVVLASSIGTVAAGLIAIGMARTWGKFNYGMSAILQSQEGWFIGAGLVLILFGFLKMTWLADLEKHPPKWTWLRTMLGVTMLWAVVSMLLAAEVPNG